MGNEFIKKDDILLKKYDDNYYVSKNGDIYSKSSGKFLKHSTYRKYHRVDIHRKHKLVHRLVYETWKGKIPEGKQINHIDDDKDNNNIDNLYAGTQKENIRDCIKNNHRVGNVKSIIVFDKKNTEILQFSPASDIIEYSGHHSISGSVMKAMKTDWFKNKYEVIEFANKKCND